MNPGVCDVLAITNSRDAMSRLDEEERGGVVTTDATSREQRQSAASESGIYKLIFQ